MSESYFFLRSNRTTGLQAAQVRGVPVHSHFKNLSVLITERCGRDAAALFAEPVISHGNGAAETTVAWYASVEGPVTDLPSLDATARMAAENALRQSIARLKPALDDSELGAALHACLNLPSLGDVLLVGGQPVLVNWGFVPEETGLATAQRERQFAGALGAIAPNLPLPPLDVGTLGPAAIPGIAEVPTASAIPASEPASAAPAPERTEQVAPATAPAVVPVAHVHPSRPWLAPAIACGLALLLLLILLIPGVLRYPQATLLTPGLSLDLQRQINASLEARIASLQAALGDNVCRAGNASLLPPLLERVPRSSASGLPAGSAPGGSAANSPSAAPSSQPAQAGGLLARLDASTALVVAQGQGTTGIGTAFFISEKHLVTNRHVIEEASQDGVGVVNQALNRLVPARVIASSSGSDIGSDDFAVLELSTGSGVALPLADTAERLQNVVAAGFPAFIMETDDGFRRLQEGDAGAIPQMAVTQGVVTAIQRGERGLGILAHTATISPGNSGGPLVDMCGRVLGMNTFQRVDAGNQLRANFALNASGLQDFLRQRGIAFQTAAPTCEPPAPTASAPQPAPSAADAAATPAPTPAAGTP